MRNPRELADAFAELGHDERALVELFLDRIRKGREAYGEWKGRGDARDFHQEALEEVLDLAAYLAMAVLRLGPERPMKVIVPPPTSDGGNGVHGAGE